MKPLNMTGMLWYDDDPQRSLKDKVLRAARHYRRKYKEEPDICFVHPSAITNERSVDGVRIRALSSVLRHHFWLGIE